jgi:hypothetical protein
MALPASVRERAGVMGIVALVLAVVSGRAWAASPLAPGTYRLEMRFASHAALPLIGAVRSTTVSTSLVEIRERGGTLEQTHRVCDARFESPVPGRIEMPPRFIAALGTHSYPIALSEDGAGWRYQADLGIEYVGWHSDDGAPLPERSDDPGVYDWDGDGRPAATLRLSLPIVPAGELYVVQRAHSVLDGRIVAADRVEGRIDVPLFEQAVIGARPGFLRRSPRATQDPERSRFVLERVGTGAACADLVQAGSDP